MITCPACGKENEDAAYECKRCRAPLRDESPPEEAAPHGGDGQSKAFGTVCSRCEAYNEPGVEQCTSCGFQLVAAEEPAPMSETGVFRRLGALPMSAEEAAEAMGQQADPALDRTPAEPFQVPGGHVEAQAAAAHIASLPTPVSSRRAPAPSPASRPAVTEPPVTTEKPCASCGAMSPPAAKFCFECGTPFAKKAAPAQPVEPESPPVPAPTEESSVHVDLPDADATMEAQPVSADAAFEQAPEEIAPADAAQSFEEPSAAEVQPEAVEEEAPAELAQPIEEAPPPFQASVIAENGPSQGTAFMLAQLENRIGSDDDAQVQLADDPFVAPCAATLLFAEDHLVLRDEGSANGVYVKVRESAALEPGDCFVCGERLLRYEGTVELPRAENPGDTPLLGAPRPQGPAIVRVVEVLTGGKVGRTCHRSGPVIAVGRTGCDLNFPADPLMGPRHAEVRLAEDGTAQLFDLAQGPSGVWIRVRQQQSVDLHAGDVLQVGEQQLRVEVA